MPIPTTEDTGPTFHISVGCDIEHVFHGVGCIHGLGCLFCEAERSIRHVWLVDYLDASLTLLPLQRISVKGIATFGCIDDRIQMTDTLFKLGIQITKVINQFEALPLSTLRLATEDCFHWVMGALHYYEESGKDLNGNNET
jgi:hypothetical protein